MFNNRIFFILLTVVSFSIEAQQLNTSPFSRYGIGEINNIQSSHYLGWSNVSIAFSEPRYVNINNPASYAGFIKHNPLFDISLSGKSAIYKSDSATSSGNNFGLNNMFLGLPITKNWGLVLGIVPYSSQGYEVSSTSNLDSNITNTFTGNGSVNKLFIGNGFNLINKGDTTKLSLGFNCSYLFGNLERLSSVIYNSSNAYNSRIQYRNSLSGWNFDGGFQFYKRFKSYNNIKRFLRLGATYSLNSNINSSNDFYAYSFVYNFSVQEINKDTIDYTENQAGEITIPQKLSFGIGYGKNNKDKRRWDLGLQYSIMDWSSFEESTISSSQQTLPLGPSSTIAVGYRITPNLDWANNNKSILSKSSYSFGYHYTKSAILIDDIGLINNGINFGLSIPLLSSRSFSMMNLSGEIGRLGELVINKIEENYFKFAIGFTMAPDTRYDRWFRKRKYD